MVDDQVSECCDQQEKADYDNEICWVLLSKRKNIGF